MKYKVRGAKPHELAWREIEADSVEDAVQNYHERVSQDSESFDHLDEDGRSCALLFMLVEIEGQEPLVSRIYSYGIRRKGGIKPNRKTLERVAERIGWTKDPNELVAPWDGGESYEEALGRK